MSARINLLEGFFACIALLGAAILPAHAVPFAVQQRHVETLTPAQAASAEHSWTPGIVGSGGKTLMLTGKTARMTIYTGPENDMLSFRIDGLRNPTLILRPGMTLHVLFINTDDDMLHCWRVGAWRLTFPNKVPELMSMPMSAGSKTLPPHSKTAYHAETFTLHVPHTPGKYTYFCTMRGHAQGGMWGKLFVRQDER